MARRGRRRVNKEPKRKAVKVRLAPREHAGKVTEPYQIMEAIIAADRPDLQDVRIGIAWHTGWRPDADGVRTHGKCIKRSELDRAMDKFDFMIMLNEQSWKAFDAAGRQRLLFHELEHAQVARDKNGEVLLDDKGRIVTRVKRHDIADFRDVIERFGLPECLADVDIADGDRPLLKLAEAGQAEGDGPAQAAAGEMAGPEWGDEALLPAERPPEAVEVRPGLTQYMGGVDGEGVVLFPQVLDVPPPAGIRGLVQLHYCRIDGGWYGGYRVELPKQPELVSRPRVTGACFDSSALCLESAAAEAVVAIDGLNKLSAVKKEKLRAVIRAAIEDFHPAESPDATETNN